MKVLKYLLLIVASLVALFFIAGLMVSKHYSCVRSVTINKPNQEVFDYVKYLQNQDNYSKWAKMDPAMKKSFTGTDAMPGATASWEGNKDVGKGEQEIKSITEGSRIDYELRFEKPMKSVAQSFMTTEAVGETSTKVSWGITGESPYPWNVMNLFMDKMLGGDLETGLNNLKTLLEK